MKSKKSRVIALCLAAALTVTVCIGATSGTKEPEVQEEDIKKDIYVDTLLPTIDSIVVTSEYIGSVEPDQQVAVIPKAQGEVLAVHYQVGDRVEAGAVLLEIDSTTVRNQVAQLQAGIASAEAMAELQLESAIREQELYHDNLLDGYNNTLAQMESAVQTAEAALETAGATLNAARQGLRQTREAYDEGMILTGLPDMVLQQAKDAVAQAEIGYERAVLAVEQAKTNLEITEKSLEDGKANIDDNVRKAELGIDMTQKQLELQQLQTTLRDYTVTAPISGVIEQRDIEQFGMASSSSPVFTISNKDMMTVSFKVPEASFSYINSGDAITLEKNGNTYIGTITEIGTMVDASGLFTMKASVENPPRDLFTGASVKIFADTQKAESAVVLPLSVLYYDNGEPYVYVYRDGVAQKTYVETGIFNADTIEIVSGVGLDDRIISTWSANLADGAEVLLASQAGSASTAATDEAVAEEPLNETAEPLGEPAEYGAQHADETDGADAAAATESAAGDDTEDLAADEQNPEADTALLSEEGSQQ